VLEVRVQGAAQLKEGQSRTFQCITAPGARARECFILRRQGQLLAFVNECPHWSVELDLGDGHFYDEGLDRIYCKNHGALFVLPHGECETGPCMGRSLTRLALRVEEHDVIVSP
jgi:nitrite reductase/ring-hydroxylating ferredoxin subunit